MANSVDPAQMLHYTASDLGLHCLLRPVCPNAKSRYGTLSYNKALGPVVQSVVSLTSSLRVIWLTVLADSIHNILIFFAEKM